MLQQIGLDAYDLEAMAEARAITKHRQLAPSQPVPGRQQIARALRGVKGAHERTRGKGLLHIKPEWTK